MTGEEAIRVLQTYGHNCKCCAKEGLEASKVAIAALKKQIPKQPDFEGDGYADGEFIFLGCYHEPYTGKWVAEIKDCPKESKEADQLISLKEVINNGIKN